MLLLFAEDEFYTRQGILGGLDWMALGVERVEACSDGKSGEEKLSLHPDILLTDIRMPYLSGLELGARAKENDPDCEVIIMSSYSDKEYLLEAISLSTVAYIEKPVDLKELAQAVQRAVLRRRQSLQLRGLGEKKTPLFTSLPHPTDHALSHSSQIAISYIVRHYMDPTLSVETLADHVHLTAAYFSGSFKEDTGKNLKRVITETRMERARELLVETNLSIGEIATKTGYRNANYFSKLFRQETGQTPLEFRNARGQPL